MTPPTMLVEMELEGTTATTLAALLEELRERMSRPETTSKRLSTLLSHRVVRVFAVVESLS
jgi:hypothetical protein